MATYQVLGLMSGTSLDGLDMAVCRFDIRHNNRFKIIKGITIKYNNRWKKKLSTAHHLSGLELSMLNNEYGLYMANQVNKFLKKNRLKVDLIASHGHTIFHQTHKKLTLQIGSGAVLAAQTHNTVVCDFRSTDIALGGQGAPLVPKGDDDLFNEYEYCLNLGGIANVSYKHNKTRKAFDICVANMALNYLAKQKKLTYDKNGRLAASGKINQKLLIELNNLKYYKRKLPKSLSREWFENEFKPILDNAKISVEDKLASVCEHIAVQIATSCYKNGKMLLSGGGAHNSFLVNRIKHHFSGTIVLPEKSIIDFKEALIFAWLGLLRYINTENVVCTYTGAKQNSISGAIYAF